MLEEKKSQLFSPVVIISSLGYFVDVYDLLLFTIVKKSSILSLLNLKNSQLAEEEFLTSFLNQSSKVLNYQMLGLLIGGILWGILGDKKGRFRVLYGSIILYSTCNFFSGFVENINQYAWLRFLTGIGLAGELGAGVTLVVELLNKKNRALGTSLIACIGLTGCVFAYMIFYWINLDWSNYYVYMPTFIENWFINEERWRITYLIGGFLGFLLLMIRLKVRDSQIYTQIKKNSSIKKGIFLQFFSDSRLFKRYICSILIGIPSWYVLGIIINQSDVLAIEFRHYSFKIIPPHPINEIQSKTSIMLSYIGLSLGDMLIGFLSYKMGSRKLPLFIFYLLSILCLVYYFSPLNNSVNSMYIICTLLGFSTGYWAMFITIAAEQFGTNLRATAATTIPNFVRGSLYAANFLFISFFPSFFNFHKIESAILTGLIFFIIAFVALSKLPDTHNKDMNYIE